MMALRFLTADATRPISIVDCANRIVASILRVTLERAFPCRISDSQRELLKDRFLLRNVVEVDLAAHTAAVRSRTVAIITFDFRAAFSAMSHDFIWHVLRASGIPECFINAIKALYVHDRHSYSVLSSHSCLEVRTTLQR